MVLSYFLAKLLGLYLMIVSLYYLFRSDQVEEIIEDFYASPALRLISAVINLLIGLLLVLLHNVWEFNWTVFITLIGYLSLAKGVMHLFFPEWGRAMIDKMSQTAFKWTGAITFLIGAFLTYHGFTS